MDNHSARDNAALSARPTRVTVVIPARNEEEYISRCLASVRSQDYKKDLLEIIVVDNGSTDMTAKIAADAGAKVLPCPDALVGKVRNDGARSGTGEIIAFIDGDCLANEKWLETAVSALQDARIGIVGGDCMPDPSGTWVERAWVSAKPGQRREVLTLPGACLAIRRTLFEEIGGFDERLLAGEDDTICVAVRDSGLLAVSIPDCSVMHLGYPGSLTEVARRQFWHGSSQLDVAESWVDRQLVLTHVFLAGAIATIPLAWNFGYAGIGLSALVWAAPIAALAAVKARNRASKTRVFVQMCAIGLFFYVGRSAGLVRNYWRAIGKRISSK